jgi:hypothetical protein
MRFACGDGACWGQRAEQFTLETAAGVLPALPALLDSEHSKYQSTSLKAAAHLVAAFGDLIRTTRVVNTAAVGGLCPVGALS